jgi:hypothetical protein
MLRWILMGDLKMHNSRFDKECSELLDRYLATKVTDQKLIQKKVKWRFNSGNV